MTGFDAKRTAPVPAGRAARLWQLGSAAGGLAVSGAARGLAAVLRGERPDPRSLFFTPREARRLAERLSRLRGAAMKLGQLVSLDGKDLLPAEFVDLLAPLRDGAHVMPFSQLSAVLEREYGSGWNRRFRRLRFSPLAAASIGQVHLAETGDGRRVALKVQYPGVRESIDSDIDNLALLLRTPGLVPAGVNLGPLLEEARRQLHQEADYAAEARSLEDYRARLGTDPLLAVPAVHADLSTPRVLAMDFADGRPVDALAGPGWPAAVRDRVALALSRLLLRELFEWGVVQTDPNFANYLYDPDSGRLHLLDFGAARRIPPARAARSRARGRAAPRGDAGAVRDAAWALGYLGGEDAPAAAEGLVELILRAAEPLRHAGVYDFGASGLLGRVHALGRDLVLRRGYTRTPPRETLLLHRKFLGTFMLCARLGARFDAGALVAPWLRERD
jgi:predicted unusual protein kinase regulating ubiquinone biosynthesis (AarF/ABC1/UbiB family)